MTWLAGIAVLLLAVGWWISRRLVIVSRRDQTRLEQLRWNRIK